MDRDMTALPDQLAVRPYGHGADILPEALASLHLSGALFLRGEFSSPWALESSQSDALARALVPGSRRVILFHVVLGGQFVVSLDGVEERLGPGDVAILPYANRHVLRSPAESRPVPLAKLLPPHPWTRLPALRHGGGGAITSIACGYLYSDDLHLSPVLAAMPPLIVVRPEQRAFRDWLTTNVRFALAETEARPGACDLLMRRLPELLFVKCLDAHARRHGAASAGWLAAAADPILGRALAEMHRYPAKPWTLQKLARTCATSRSVLDERFYRLLGCPPMRYLTFWRLQLAARRLRTSADSVAQIAGGVGYGAVASFSRAFKRHTGVSPQEWRSRRAVTPRAR
jgi:AraC family transcriptional regulator, alkane utilization regulator